MKQTQWLTLAAILALSPLGAVRGQTPAGAPATAGVAMSTPTSEVVKLASGGTSEEVILAYVQNTQAPFSLTADNVLYLKDVGVSSAVITAMMNHDAALKNQTPSYSYNQTAYAPQSTAPAPAAPGAEVTTAVSPAVAAGSTATLVTSAPAAPGAVAAPAPAVVAAAPAPAYVTGAPADVTYFYTQLAPYGSWVELPGYGWCWQPSVVVATPGWRPYWDSGHWVYTDAGWFWASDYSWGWAPFHYGRWYMHPHCGWVWCPDRVWGPSWVTWRVDDGHCGWAPLPPHAEFDVNLGFRFNGVHVGVDFDFGLRMDDFNFVALVDFTSHDVWHHRCGPAEVVRVYNHTTIINNYVVNHSVVSRGVQVERVAAATHTSIRTTVIRDVPAGSPLHGGGVYRPQLTAPAHSVTMTAQHLDARNPVIQHGPAAASRTETHVAEGRFSSPASSAAPVNHAGGAPNSGAASSPASHAQPQANAGRFSSASPAASHATAAPAETHASAGGAAAGASAAKPAPQGQQHYSLQMGVAHPGTSLPASANRNRSVQSTPRSIAESRRSSEDNGRSESGGFSNGGGNERSGRR